MYGQIRKEIAVNNNNTNTNTSNNTNTTMNMMIDVNDCDPEVEEVTGSLVQRLKLDQQQKEQLQQQQQHQSLQRIQSRLSTAINANAAIIATLVSQNGTITGTGTSTNECEAVAVTMATATESFETALHQIQHQHQHHTQTQHLTLTSGNLHAKSYRDTNSHSNLSTHSTNANANANANDIIYKNQGFNDYIKDQLNGTHNHNRNHPSPTYQDQNEHEHAQQGQSQHQGQDGTCTMKQKEHIHDKTSANANLNSNPRTVSELTVSELFASELTASELTASELTASELTASELTASELTVSESNRNHNVLKESPYNSDSGYAGSASSNDTGSGSSSDSDRKQDYDEHEHEHGHDLGHHGHGHGHGHGRKTNGTRAEARAINRHGKRDASSSDLADFSSSSMSALGASGSGSASGSACASASDTRRRSGSASGSGSACSYSSSSLASPLMNAIAMQIGVASLPLSEESGSGLLDLDPTGTRNLYQSTAVKPSGNRHGHGHGHGHGSVQSKGVRFGTEREQKREREREWEQERTSANNSNSSFPSRHRRRHNTKTHRDREKEHKHTTRTTVNANANSNADNDHLMNKANDAPPTYKLPGSWSFVERQLKRKMDHEDCIIKKLYEDQRKELDSNFKNAMKRTKTLDNSLISNSSPIYDVGVDVMANILSYLKPVQAYSILSLPISKTFQSTFSNPQDLWRVLCLSAPFYAKQDKAFYAKQDKAKDKDSSDDSSSYPVCNDIKVNHLLGRYRLLYSSLIKCVRYLDRIQEDSRNGRTPAGVYDSDDGSIVSLGSNNMSLKNFFATVHATRRNENADDDDGDGNGSSSISSNSGEWGIGQKKECSNANAYANGVGNENKTGTTTKSAKKLETKAKVKYGVSKLTNRLLGPSHLTGVAGNISLPWSCAIYSVVNWMVAFADVAGIQQMCLKVLPDLLVDEQQRTSAQHAGLTEIVLRAMVLFPDMVDLHTSAFHTLVLLARPLGGKEGMLYHTSMVNASGLFNVGSSTGKSGIAIMLDSMKRFVCDEDLQAMSCWSMVNIALIPSQKVVLVRLGGISAAGNAMIHHPHNAEVQFRALFALINLVIPSENISDNPVEAQTIMDQIAGMNQDSEVEMLNDSMEQVTNLVVVAMKNFCSSEAILNRACLVLHNLSLNEGYHRVLLLTPNCYQMLQWCIGNYRHDAVLQQSARGTLQRLQLTLSSDPSLREQFTAGLGIQQQHQQLAAPANNSDAALVPPQEQPLEPNVIHELGR